MFKHGTPQLQHYELKTALLPSLFLQACEEMHADGIVFLEIKYQGDGKINEVGEVHWYYPIKLPSIPAPEVFALPAVKVEPPRRVQNFLRGEYYQSIITPSMKLLIEAFGFPFGN